MLEFETLSISDLPQQPNAYDCGIYTVVFHQAIISYIVDYQWTADENYFHKNSIESFLNKVLIETITVLPSNVVREQLQKEFARYLSIINNSSVLSSFNIFEILLD